MANLGKVVKLTESQYEQLLAGGTVSGETYSANNIYLVDTPSLYHHTVKVMIGNASGTDVCAYVYLQIISTKSDSYDSTSLKEYLLNNSAIYDRFPASGVAALGTFGQNTNQYMVYGINAYNNTIHVMVAVPNSSTSYDLTNIDSINDIVTKIM